MTFNILFNERDSNTMSAKTEIRISCQDCLFFDDLIHQTEHSTCKAGGVLKYNTPCANFCVNAKAMTLINNQNPEIMAYIRKVPSAKLSELAALLVQEGYNREYGWSIGDIAYYSLSGTDYISSYVQVVFKGMAGNMGLALIEGTKDKRKIWNGLVELHSLIRDNEWPAKHQELLKKGNIIDDSMYQFIPNYNYPTVEELSLTSYKPHNIIDVINSMEG